jgi:hypothetical protein
VQKSPSSFSLSNWGKNEPYLRIWNVFYLQRRRTRHSFPFACTGAVKNGPTFDVEQPEKVDSALLQMALNFGKFLAPFFTTLCPTLTHI